VPRARSLALAAGLIAAALSGAARAAGDDDMTLGSPKAPVTVIEYASPTCPHCARFRANVFPAFKAKYVDTGKVRFVLREEPIHPDLDGVVFLLARCAGPSRYFTVLDDVMRAQPEFFDASDEADMSRKFYAVLMREAHGLGLSDQQAMSCMSDPAAIAALNSRVQREVQQYAVDHTPTVVVGGVKLETPGDREIEPADLDAAVQAALAHKRS
jgi:protein-disulfide isomerase